MQAPSTSLAKQLGQLKLQQRDEIELPSRVKISFLFDVKQAANIDDQTLFYIMQSGVQALSSAIDLQPFAADLLNEKSLQFYRATETAETLEPIEQRLDLLLKMLAPFALESACHKVLEYLIRIYDVHVYHKAVLINAFLPYFETAYFLRAIQLLNLEKDQQYGFLHQFAYKGTAIDRANLVKCLGQTSGIVLTKYAEFCFSLLSLPCHEFASQHWKFFGSMMVEVLRAQSNDQNLMFSCLPYISKALKQTEVRDLQIAGFLAVSQLACRRSLSVDYTNAFVRQTLQTVAASEDDEDVQLKGLAVLLLLVLYQGQSLKTLKAKDLKLVLSNEDLPALMEKLSQQYDTSGFAKVLAMTVIKEPKSDPELLKPLLETMIKAQLKTTFVLIQAIIFEAVEKVEAEPRCIKLLEMIKELQPSEFNQSAVYLLKKISSDLSLKEQVLKVLSGGASSEQQSQSNLLSTFGDKEYSILSALASAHQQTKLSALQALQDTAFVESLLPNEQSLVKLVLLQTISQQAQLPNALSLMVKAIVKLVKAEDVKEADPEFECLETLLDSMYRSSTEVLSVGYSDELKEVVAKTLVNDLHVGKQSNQIKQIWIALTFHMSSTNLTQARNAFYSYLQAASLVAPKQNSKSPAKSPKKISNDALIESFITKPIQVIKFILEVFANDAQVPAYLDFTKIASLLQKLGQKAQTNMMKSSFIQQLYLPLLKSIESKLVPHSDKLLGAIVGALPKIEESLQENAQNLLCLEALMRVAVCQKQVQHAEFNFSGLFQSIFQQTLSGNKNLLADFLVKTAIESSSTLARVFAILHLTQLHKSDAASATESSMMSLRLNIDQETALGVTLILLNEESSVLRQHAINFAQVYDKAVQQATFESNQVRCFASDQKIVSQVKRSADNFAPLKSQTTLSLLKTLFKVRMEVVQDRNQLQTTLTKVKNLEVFEHLVRSLSDYPTMPMKSKLVTVLALVRQQSLVFAMNLCKVQDKLFAEVNQLALKKGKLEPDCLQLLIQLAGLIQAQHEQAMARDEAIPELMVSLIIPFVQYVAEKQEMLVGEILNSIKQQECVSQLKDTIVGIFERNILQGACLKDQDEQIINDIFRLYLQLQSGLLKSSQERLKSLFIDQANARAFTGAHLAMVLKKTLQKTLDASESSSQKLDILLETIVQVQLSQSRERLNQEALNVISSLLASFCSTERANLNASDYAFTIQLASQLCIQTLGSAKKSGETQSAIEGTLSDLVAKLLAFTKGKVVDMLEKADVHTEDPFNAFMTASKQKGKKSASKAKVNSDEEMGDSEDDDGEDIDNELLPCYQLIIGLLSLLTKTETVRKNNIAQTTLRLKELAAFVLTVATFDTRQAVKQKEQTQALFQLYQGALHKTSITVNASESQIEEFPLKSCLKDYSELVVSLFDGAYEELLEDGSAYLRIVSQAGLYQYGFVAGLLLIARATKDGKLQISETLQIDCSTPKSSGSALYLLKQLLLQCLEREQNLSSLDFLLYSLSQVTFCDEINDYLGEKTRLVFSQEQDGAMRTSIDTSITCWLKEQVLAGDKQSTRKFVYLGICVLEQSISASQEFQTQLSRLAGTETPAQEIQNQLVNCLLSSYLISQANTRMMNLPTTHSDKQFKNSLLRLSRNTKKLQQALNEMFSLQIHVEIVMKILDFGEDGENQSLTKKERLSLIPLKNNCLQLLNEKISSYNQGFLSKASKSLQNVFKRLIERAIEILQQNGGIYGESKAAAKASSINDITALNENLMAILQYTCCAKTLSKQMQTSSLKIVQAYQTTFKQSENRLRHFQLQTQLTLTEFSLFEAYSLSILEDLPIFFEHVIQGFAKVKEVLATAATEGDSALFVDTYQAALLKASISIVSIFFKFLTARQLEQIIVAVATSRAASSSVADENSQVSIVLDTISQEAKANKKLTAHATFNAYHEVVTTCIGKVAVFEQQASKYFVELLCPVMKNLPAKFVQEHSKKFITFLKECFSLSSRAAKQSVEVSAEIQSAIVECFNAFVVKLSEEQLRPAILQVTKWAMKEKGEAEFDFHKAFIFCKLLSGVLSTLKEFFVPLIAIFFDAGILKILTTLVKLLRGTNSLKRSRAQIEHSEVPQELSEALLVELCRSIQLLFKHDATCFIQNDSFEKLIDSVADLVTLLKVNDFIGFVESSVKPMVFEMNDRINEDSMWLKMNYAILLKTRSEQWMTRQAALLVIEHLFETLRERYLVVLNDTIPFLSELLEDENEKVEQTARRIVERVEQMTGESIHDYLK